MPVIRLTTRIHAPLDIVFDLSRSIDLHKVSTAHTSEEAVEGKTSGLIGMSETVTWRARHLLVKQRLTTKITSYNRPFSFTDEMVSGAFQSFKHDHIFHEETGAVIMEDLFSFISPFGLLGKLADRLFLRKYMERLLQKRNAIIKQYAEEPALYKKILPHVQQDLL